MTQIASILTHIDNAIQQGWLAPLDKAFVKFLAEQEPHANDSVLWLGALVSQQWRQGEVFLDLNKLCQNPLHFLALTVENSSDELTIINSFKLEYLLEQLKQSSLVSQQQGSTPLVLADNRLYLRRYWCYQQTVNQAIGNKLTQIRDQLPSSFVSNLTTLFPASISTQPNWQKIACTLALRSRFCIITGGPGTGKTTTLTKLLTLMIQLTRDELGTDKKLTILLAAPTGKAAARVSQSINDALSKLTIADDIKQLIPKKASTLHRLLGSRPDTRLYRYHRDNRLPADLVIVDEASMIDLEMMAALLDALPNSTQLILLGDKDQLASVEAGSVLGDLCLGSEAIAYDSKTLKWIKDYSGETLTASALNGSGINQQTVILSPSYRFGPDSGIGQLAKAVNAGHVAQAQAILNNPAYGDLIPISKDYARLRAHPEPELANNVLKLLVKANYGDDNGKANVCQGYGYYLDKIILRPTEMDAIQTNQWAIDVLKAFDTFQVLCAIRNGDWGVEGINQKIERWLFGTQKLPQWYEGRPVMITRNDYHLGLMNGDIGITLKDSNNKLRVAFLNTDAQGNDPIHWVSPLRLPDVTTVFAMTVHKSQGSEFNHVALVMPETNSLVLTRELIYTGITRAKEKFTLIESQAGIFNQAILSSCLS